MVGFIGIFVGNSLVVVLGLDDLEDGNTESENEG
jgi:hypothetical protein